jgi:alkylated DNA repair dioxygenase AlkB
MQTILATENSSLKIMHDFLSDEKLETLFENCKTLELIKNPKIKVFGKEATMHRSVGFFSDESEGYKYSGQMAQSQPLPKFLKKLLKRVNEKFDTDFNGILVNRYEDGSDSIGAHSDDEKGLGKGGSVVGISLGAERVMRFRGKKTPLIVDDKKFLDMSMPHGCLFIMDGDFQKEFTHEVPVKKSVTEMRISLTFRKHTS